MSMFFCSFPDEWDRERKVPKPGRKFKKTGMRKASEPERRFHLEPRGISAKNLGEGSSKNEMKDNPNPSENSSQARELFSQKTERGTQVRLTKNAQKSVTEMQSPCSPKSSFPAHRNRHPSYTKSHLPRSSKPQKGQSGIRGKKDGHVTHRPKSGVLGMFWHPRRQSLTQGWGPSAVRVGSC